MTPPSLQAEAFRTAVEADDFTAIDAAVPIYLEWFRSRDRTLAEVAQARDLFDWVAQAAIARRAHLADELARLTTFFAGYRPPRRSNTWHLDV